MEPRVSSLPPELREKILSNLPADLQTLCVTGHILVTESRTVFLPSGMIVNAFAVGAGGGGWVS